MSQSKVKIKYSFNFLILLLVFLGGCETAPKGPKIYNIEKSFKFLQEVVASQLPVGQRAVSPNGREFLSKHFIPKMNEYLPAEDAPRRWFAHVFILGDRRPYDIEVLVKREKRVLSKGVLTYKPDGLDQRIASDLKTRIQDQLSKRREDSNLIDDFRVF